MSNRRIRREIEHIIMRLGVKVEGPLKYIVHPNEWLFKDLNGWGGYLTPPKGDIVAKKA